MAVVNHPEGAVYVKVRPHYVLACDGDYQPALLLSVLEMWTGIRARNNRDGWIFRTQDELARDTAGVLTPRQIRKAIERLLELGLVERRRNPDYRWDRTYQYRLDIEALNALIAEISADLAFKRFLIGGHDNIEDAVSDVSTPTPGTDRVHAEATSSAPSKPSRTGRQRICNTEDPEDYREKNRARGREEEEMGLYPTSKADRFEQFLARTERKHDEPAGGGT